MSLLDFNIRLTPTAQAFTSSGAVSTNAYPLVQAGRDIARGEPLAMVFTVTTAALKVASETYLFRVQTATASDGTTGAIIIASTGTYTMSGGTTPIGALGAGAQVVLPIPPGIIPATATHIAGFVVLGGSGGISCHIDIVPLSLAVQNYKAYSGAPTFAA